MNPLLDEYRLQIAADEGLKAKRRNLVMLSAVLIALNFSGAVIKEANTFLFKIEFTDQHGINELFFCLFPTCCFDTIRMLNSTIRSSLNFGV
ncbi:hypothetical protein [Vibrio harveyi]|uniref:hypothetical protein n=1 Tax=Vibrio harveyi TaxID=669 RepID=UPI001F465DA0|nr:hypothetical protein [Vibrio harveyi]UIL59074.1 hypothetical protein LXG94_12925 [Vibrio harveyi]